MVLIGIDPGESNGIADWRPDPKELRLYTKTFWDTYEFVTENYDPDQTVIYMENPGKNNPVFEKKNPKKKLSRRAFGRKAQNVGMNKQDANRLIQGFRRAGFVVMEIRPASKKWTAKEFTAYTGMDITTNEHTRDAAKLVYGRVAVAKPQFELLKKQAEADGA